MILSMTRSHLSPSLRRFFGGSVAVTFSILVSTPSTFVFCVPSTISISHGIFLRKFSASVLDIQLGQGPAVQACSDGSSLLPVTIYLRSAAFSGFARSMPLLPHISTQIAPVVFPAPSIISLVQSAGISMHCLFLQVLSKLLFITFNLE